MSPKDYAKSPIELYYDWCTDMGDRDSSSTEPEDNNAAVTKGIKGDSTESLSTYLPSSSDSDEPESSDDGKSSTTKKEVTGKKPRSGPAMVTQTEDSDASCESDDTMAAGSPSTRPSFRGQERAANNGNNATGLYAPATQEMLRRASRIREIHGQGQVHDVDVQDQTFLNKTLSVIGVFAPMLIYAAGYLAGVSNAQRAQAAGNVPDRWAGAYARSFLYWVLGVEDTQ
ncbi:hypothetical protein TWF696_004633 [Orbilia brochopaga]|uniref:Uncharacterized protein n=1 Tax=Orbilia brochopaga TaxID=3140254 RepID=A0AAV9V7W8_9PEZI